MMVSMPSFRSLCTQGLLWRGASKGLLRTSIWHKRQKAESRHVPWHAANDTHSFLTHSLARYEFRAPLCKWGLTILPGGSFKMGFGATHSKICHSSLVRSPSTHLSVCTALHVTLWCSTDLWTRKANYPFLSPRYTFSEMEKHHGWHHLPRKADIQYSGRAFFFFPLLLQSLALFFCLGCKCHLRSLALTPLEKLPKYLCHLKNAVISWLSSSPD